MKRIFVLIFVSFFVALAFSSCAASKGPSSASPEASSTTTTMQGPAAADTNADPTAANPAAAKPTGLPQTSGVVEAGKDLVVECAKKKAAREACSNMGWPGSTLCEKGVEAKFGKMNCPLL